MDEFFTYPENDYRFYLEHHGVPGQKWGVRNAAWYPISAFRAASNKIGTKVHEFKEKRAAERKRKQRVATLKKARKAKENKAAEAKKEEKRLLKSEEEKQRILREGTPGEIMKIRGQLSDKEIQDAVFRQDNMNKLRQAESVRLKSIKDAEFEAKYGKVIKAYNAAVKAADLTVKVTDAYKKVDSILNPEGPKVTDPLKVLSNKNSSDEDVKNAAIRTRNLKTIRENLGLEPKKKDDDSGNSKNSNKDDSGNSKSAKKMDSKTYDDALYHWLNSSGKETSNTPISDADPKVFNDALDHWLKR